MTAGGAIVVFLGPTLGVAEARDELEAVYLPPAAQGDVYRVALERPIAIGLVDGYFERVPAVWHKELIWARAQGIHVIGASSMGALRAVELAPYGMEGVGEVYRQFQTGELEDDDEVAVTHGSAEDGYRAMSVAMVNIRATLRAATAAGAISVHSQARLVEAAKALFYPDRSYPRLLQSATARALPARELNGLASFLEHGRVDQKRLDALLLLRRLRGFSEYPRPPAVATVDVAQTAAFTELQRWAEGQPALLAPSAEAVSATLVAAELRLQPQDRSSIWRAAVARAQAHLSALRRPRRKPEGANAMHSPQANVAEDWCTANGLSGSSLDAYLDREEYMRRLARRCGPILAPFLADELRSTGAYPALAARAQAKLRLLARLGLENPSPRDVHCTASELVDWYFAERLGRAVPTDMDAYLTSHGLANLSDLLCEAARERLFIENEQR